MRDSPALALIAVLQQRGARVRVYDPQGMENAALCLADVVFARDGYDCVAGAHCAVLATEWAELRRLDPARIAASMAGTVFVDLRAAFDPAVLIAAGLSACGVGYPAAPSAASARRRPAPAPSPVTAQAEAERIRVQPGHHVTLQ
jgi:UDPglucose 6-dehydrogenase